MFLQDNDHFGHSLQEAAKLIGKTPGRIEGSPELNIRGAAALLKKLYDENPKPDFAKPDEMRVGITPSSDIAGFLNRI